MTPERAEQFDAELRLEYYLRRGVIRIVPGAAPDGSDLYVVD